MTDDDPAVERTDGGKPGDSGGDEGIRLPDRLIELNDEYQQSDSAVSEMVLSGPLGFHTFYDNALARRDATRGATTAMHRAFEDVIEESVCAEPDVVGEKFGEVTPETVAKTIGEQLRFYYGNSSLVDEFERKLEGALREQAAWDGDDGGG